MSAAPNTYKRVELQRFPASAASLTAENRFWHKFKRVGTAKHVASVTHVDFSPTLPHDFAIAASTRVVLHSGATAEEIRTISRFKDIAYSPSYRRDGRLLVAGCEDRSVSVFDVSKRFVLRTFCGHTAPVRSTRFMADNTRVVSCSDDKSVRVWDLPREAQLQMLSGHADYVRCSALNAANDSLLVTGSYDHRVKVWDLRSNTVVMEMDHGFPVEAVLCLPGGGIVVSSGDSVLKVWDIMSGGQLLHSASNHQKTITCLAVDGQSSRLLSGSVDQQVKFYDLADFSVTHSIKFPSAVMSLGLSPDDTTLAAGLLDGTLVVRKRAAPSAEEGERMEARRRAVRTGTYRYFVRGKTEKPAEDDFRVEAFRKRKLQEYDQYLKKFQYSAALEAALQTKHAVIVTSVLDELRQRDGLRLALRNRTDAELVTLLTFILRHINNPHYAAILIDTAELVLDLYGSSLGSSMAVDDLVYRLKRKLHEEQELQKQLLRLMGTMDVILAQAPALSGVAATPAPGAQQADRAGGRKHARDAGGRRDDSEDEREDELPNGAAAASAAPHDRDDEGDEDKDGAAARPSKARRKSGKRSKPQRDQAEAES